MALFSRTPDGLVEIADRVYVFRTCLMSSVMDEDKYRDYIKDIVTQLEDTFPDASYMVFNFREEGRNRSKLPDLLSSFSHDFTVLDYPRQYKGCPLLAAEAMNHALKVGEIWLSVKDECNIVLMHCEPGCWAVLAFMLAALLLYRNLSSGKQSTLEMMYAKAPRDLIQSLSPLNPMASQVRYMRYISRKNVTSVWPLDVPAVILDCVILRRIPAGFSGEDGCRLIVLRVHGKDPLLTGNENTTRVLFSSKPRALYNQANCELVKIEMDCDIQGDVAIECISVDAGHVPEEMVFRVMFNTTFIRSNALVLNRDEIDISWDAKDQFPEEFRAEVLVSEVDSANQFYPKEVAGVEEEGLPMEAFTTVQEIVNSTNRRNPKKDDVSPENIPPQQKLGIPFVTKGTPPPPPPPRQSAPMLVVASHVVMMSESERSSQSSQKHSDLSPSLHQSPPPPPPPPPPPSVPNTYLSRPRHYLKH